MPTEKKKERFDRKGRRYAWNAGYRAGYKAALEDAQKALRRGSQQKAPKPFLAMVKYRKNLKSKRPRAWKKTLRLIFAYDGTIVRPISKQRVKIIPPASAAPHPEKGQPGFWYELRNAKDQVLYFRIIQSPISFDAEVFSEGKEPSIRRHEVTTPKGEFELLVPDTPEGRSIVIFSPPLKPRAFDMTSEMLGRFKLNEIGYLKKIGLPKSEMVYMEKG